MLKGIGCVCIACGALWGYGYLMGRLKDRERQLFAIKELLIIMEQQMLHRGLPMGEVLHAYAEKTEGGLRGFFLEYVEELDRHQAEYADVLWCRILTRYQKVLALYQDEYAILADIGSLMEPIDSGSQAATIQLYKQRIDERIQVLWSEKGNKQKVYQSICLMGGVALMIMLW